MAVLQNQGRRDRCRREGCGIIRFPNSPAPAACAFSLLTFGRSTERSAAAPRFTPVRQNKKFASHLGAFLFGNSITLPRIFVMNQKTAPCSGTSPEQGALLCNYPVVLFLNSSVPSVRAFPFWRILMMEIVLSHAVTSLAFREETLFLPFHPVPPQPLHKLLRQRRGERHPFPRPWVRERKRVRVEHQAGDFRASS